jgi:hypothetical protein
MCLPDSAKLHFSFTFALFLPGQVYIKLVLARTSAQRGLFILAKKYLEIGRAPFARQISQRQFKEISNSYQKMRGSQ